MKNKLVDTSFWVNFFKGDSETEIMKTWLKNDEVLMHGLVYAELMLGGASEEQLNLLDSLRYAENLPYDIIIRFIKEYQLSRQGIGWVDVSLLASARYEKLELMTYDKKLISVAEELQL